ncbi:MAG: hypothetical protein HYV02_02190 [Deltaproteobacteria bacterium]|nr:hypothetical protein [Deltaproteobacteria bacterium]
MSRTPAVLILHRPTDASIEAPLRALTVAAHRYHLAAVLMAAGSTSVSPGIADDVVAVGAVQNHAAMFAHFQQINERYQIHRIFTFDDTLTLAAAYFREELNIPGLRPNQVIGYRDRERMYAMIRQLGLPGCHLPETVLLDQFAGVRDLLTTHGKIIVKPHRWDPLRPSVILSTPAQLAHQWHFLGEHRTKYRAEAFIRGTKYSIDTLVQKNAIVCDMLFEYQYGMINHHYEVRGMLSRQHHLRPIEQTLLTRHRLLLQHLAFPPVTHAEYLCTPSGKLYFVEISARFGSGPTLAAMHMATGLDLAYEWAVGELDPTCRTTVSERREVIAQRLPPHGTCRVDDSTYLHLPNNIVVGPQSGQTLSSALLLGDSYDGQRPRYCVMPHRTRPVGIVP